MPGLIEFRAFRNRRTAAAAAADLLAGLVRDALAAEPAAEASLVVSGGSTPGPCFDLRPVSLDLSFGDASGARYPDAYERLLIEIIRGNPSLFMRRDEVEFAWGWIDGIIAGWEESGQRVETYVAGTWGPTASSLMLDRDDRTWFPD